MNRHPIWPLFFGLAIAVVVVDQLTKAWLVSWLAPGASAQVIGDYLRLVHSQNNGALFGLFRESALVFAVISIGVIGLIVAYHGRVGRSTYMSIALGLLLGGAVGNVTDRFRLGHVVDFVDAGIGAVRWYTFNVADSAISVAIVMLILAAIWPALLEGRKPPPEAAKPADPVGPAEPGEPAHPASPVEPDAHA
jgi:signal peptidase II